MILPLFKNKYWNNFSVFLIEYFVTNGEYRKYNKWNYIRMLIWYTENDMQMLCYTEKVQKFMQELRCVRLKYALLNTYSIMLPFCVSQLGAKKENNKKE